MKRLFFILVCGVGFCGESWGQSWFELGTDQNALKANSYIYSICADDSNNIYAAGLFCDSVVFANGKQYVAKWSAVNRKWGMLGVGSSALSANSTIETICVDKAGAVYAGGNFSDGLVALLGHKYVAKWNPVSGTWTQLGTGATALNATGAISSLCVDDSFNVYAAGTFVNASGYRYVAKWDGTTWTELYGLNANSNIESICLDDSLNVYAGGNFTDIAGRTYVAKYNPRTMHWSELGIGFDSASTGDLEIRSLMSDSSNHVIAAVNFENVAGDWFSNVFKWNGYAWNQLGALDGNNPIYAICKGDSGVVYAGGLFTNASSQKYVAKYDPASNIWSELGHLNPHSATFSNVGLFTICADKDNHIYTAGVFTDTNDFFYVAEYAMPYLEINAFNQDMQGIKLYPNPAHENINFRLPACGDATVKLSDISGRIMDSKVVCNSSNVVIDIHGYTPGTYFYEILFNGKMESGEILIQ